jgi:hypothetical protein
MFKVPTIEEFEAWITSQGVTRKQVAAEIGITPQAIYSRLNPEGTCSLRNFIEMVKVVDKIIAERQS